MKPEKQVIGRWDCVEFVDFKLFEVRVKIDTGAYTSSLRCESWKEIDLNGETFLEFVVMDDSTGISKLDRTFKTSDYSIRKVKNSAGTLSLRYSINTTIHIFKQDHKVEFTLAHRKGLKFPVLLGRKFLGNHYLVDPHRTMISHKQAHNSSK
jgi:hypothetical protein